MPNPTADELLDQDIREEFAKHRSPFRVCRQLDVSLDRVRRVIGEQAPSNTKNIARFGGRGRPELEKFAVARKNVNESWDNNSVELINARSSYEAGTHEMCQGRDGDTIIQYSIPRTIIEPRPNYFKAGAD
jgi:hypothetical protein